MKDSRSINKEVIVINYTGRKGGGALVAYEMSKALLDKGEAVVAILSTQIENIKMWKTLGLERIITVKTYSNKVNFIINTLLFNIRFRNKILEEMKEYEIKAVYSPMLTFWTGYINCLFPKAKKIVVCHDPVPHSGESKILQLLGHRGKELESADEIIVHSRRFVQYVQDKYGKAYYMPLGPHSLYRMAENKRNIVSYNSDTINFLFFGRIEAYKGLDILAEAYGKLKKEHAEITLTIIGNGDFSNYEKQYSKLHDVNIINRWIRDEEVESVFLGNNLINICPYKDATQSGVVLVAYSYGVPVIATKTGGLTEQVVDGKTGFLVRPNDANELEAAMRKFIQNDNLIQKLQQGIMEYLDKISWEKSAEKLLDLI